MKRRFLWLLLALPLLLGGALYFVQKERHRRLEAKFNQVVKSYRDDSMQMIVSITLSESEKSGVIQQKWVGTFQEEEQPIFPTDLKLVRAPRPHTFQFPCLSVDFEDGGSVGSVWSLRFALDSDENWLNFQAIDDRNDFKNWADYQLAPESCRAVKKLITSRFGKEIAALKETTRR